MTSSPSDKLFKERRYLASNIRRVAQATLEWVKSKRSPLNPEMRTMLITRWEEIVASDCVWDRLTDAQKRVVNMALFNEDPEDTEDDA